MKVKDLKARLTLTSIREAIIMINTEPKYDARVKLTVAQKEAIKMLHGSGYSIRAIAKKFYVSRRTVQFIIYPERLEAMRAKAKEKRAKAKEAK